LFWQAVEVKMSSSKIIKQAEFETSGFTEFSFANIRQPRTTTEAVHHADGFVPMGLFQDVDFDDSAQEEIVDTGPPPLEISEEDLNQRVSDSFNDGLKEGKELAERGLINVFRALRASSEAIHNLREKVLRESEDELLNLILLVARKVIIQEVTQDRSILAGVVQHAIAGLSAREEITVRINPDDYQLVTSGRDQVLHNELINERLLLKPDPSVAAGFCLVDSAMGTIDASLDSQLDQVFRSLLDQRTVAAVEEP